MALLGLLTLVLTAPALAGPPPTVLLVDEAEEDPWSARLLRELGRRVERLGARVVPPELSSTWGTERLEGTPVWLETEPATIVRPETKVRVRLKGGAETVVLGRGDELDRLAEALARALARALGLPRPADCTEPGSEPFETHLLLGRAELRARSGAWVQARLLARRALARIARPLPGPALDLLRTVRDAPSEDLVRAALDRARAAEREGRREAALEAVLDAFRYGAPAALRWRLPLPKVRTVHAEDDAIRVLAEDRWVRFDAENGRLAGHGPASRPFALLNGELFELEGGTLRRRTEAGQARWKMRLPSGLDAPRISAAGQLALTGARGLAWLETSLGRIEGPAEGVRALGVGEPGVLATGRKGGTEGRTQGRAGDPPIVALYRPGRLHPTWTATVSAPPRASVLTTARAVLRTEAGVEIFDAHQGRRVGPPFVFGAAARVASAAGRHAVIALGGARAQLLDILAGTEMAEVEGPAQLVAALASGFSQALVYESGDVLFWDPDGVLLGRAQVRGRPVAAYAPPPGQGGVLVETEHALWSLAEPSPEGETDVDLSLRAARLAQALGRSEDARAWVEHARRAGAGDLEGVAGAWASLARDPSARASALERARAVPEPTTRLPEFSTPQASEGCSTSTGAHPSL